MVLKTLSTYPPRLIFRIFKSLLQELKNLKKAQKEQLNLTFSEDLTAVSLVWTIFQTKPTTNDCLHYTLIS